jgi:hypothetical protein
MAESRPPQSVDAILRETQQQILLIRELQPGGEVLSVPRAWLESWYNDLTRAIVLWLAQP